MPHYSPPSEEDRNFDPAWLDPNQIPLANEGNSFNRRVLILFVQFERGVPEIRTGLVRWWAGRGRSDQVFVPDGIENLNYEVLGWQPLPPITRRESSEANT